MKRQTIALAMFGEMFYIHTESGIEQKIMRKLRKCIFRRKFVNPKRVTYRVLQEFRANINSGFVDWYHLVHGGRSSGHQGFSDTSKAEYEAYSDASFIGRGSLLFEAGQQVDIIGNLRGRWLLADRIRRWLIRYADSQPKHI